MNTEERLLMPDSTTPQALFAVEREVHMLRETCGILRGEIVTLKQNLATARREIAHLKQDESSYPLAELEAARKRLGL